MSVFLVLQMLLDERANLVDRSRNISRVCRSVRFRIARVDNYGHGDPVHILRGVPVHLLCGECTSYRKPRLRCDWSS